LGYINWMIFSKRNKKVNGLDQASIGILYDRHSPWLFGVCLQYMGNREDAEDVLHDGFMKIILNIGDFKEQQPGSLEGWMRKIMVNTALKYIRDHKKERMSTELYPGLDIQDDFNDQDDFNGYDFSKDQLMEFISELPVGYRTVFNLYVMENYTHKEIGELLGIAENTSKSQLSKARCFLRKLLSEYQNEMNYAKAESNR
jgi:RNA polymerase sigma-70 factor (ECF subfamily)